MTKRAFGRSAEAGLRADLLSRAPLWKRIGERLDALDREPPRSVRDASALVEDYHGLARDLARARRLAPDSRAREYLEASYARAHGIIHRPAAHAGYALWSLFRDRLPGSVAQLRTHIAWVTAWFLIAALCGWWLIHRYPELVSLFASEEMIATVERGELWTDGLLNVAPSSVLSIQILTNNIVVSVFAFTAGLLFGLGTFYIVGLNGMMLGAVFAFTRQHEMDGRLFEFVVAHGVVELSCICLSGAAGAALGDALARPGESSRSEAFAAAARRALPLMAAVVMLLLGCGFIEGYLSPDPEIPLAARMVVGFGYFFFMIALLRGWVFGRSRGTPDIQA